VPLLELAPGRFLPESNAILLHLAEGTPFLPQDAWERAQVYRWLFWEQYQHEPNVAVARFIVHYLGRPAEHEERLCKLQAKSQAVLGLMDEHLRTHDFMAGSCCTVADIALYAYTHVAPHGGIALEPFPAVQAWLARMVAQPGHTPMGL
jgi:glutathione S-transferase